MRIVLFTGKGGVGKSTIAAGTAVLAARSGTRVLVLSTDTAHSLADAFGVQLHDGEPTYVEPNLYVQQVDAQQRFEQSWAEIQRYLLSVLDASGVDPITAEELTVVPGAEEVLALLEVRTQVLSQRWDAVIVDCAPTAETLRLLALPEALQWYMQRVFPIERRVVRTLRPVLNKATGVPMPTDTVLDALDRLHKEMAQVRTMLSGPEASVRIVFTPETVVLAEARRTLTALSLYGYRVDGVVANRIFPETAGDAWRESWVDAQRAVLEEARESFGALRLWRSTYLPAEPVGTEALADLAAQVYAAEAPLDAGMIQGALRFDSVAEGTLMALALPNITKSEVDLVRHGDELVITVGPYRRVLALPTAVSKAQITGARVHEGELQVRFGGTDV